MKSIEYIDSNLKSISQDIDKGVELKNNGEKVSDITLVSFTSISPAEGSLVKLIDGVPTESREMAGEPDGKADSDDLDELPPDLPTTPPPLMTDHIPRPSFLHNIGKEKPKLPAKPKLRDKSPPRDLQLDLSDLMECPPTPDPSLSPSARHCFITKRQAPKPPPTPLGESPPKSGSPSISGEEESPPTRRERASSCSPLPCVPISPADGTATPEPPARRSLSLSHEALASPLPLPALDKKKAGHKMRSTLRKFLRLASREELGREEGTTTPPPLPPPRPRPEIIHPLDLNKSGVQVLRSDGSLVTSSKTLSSSPETPSSPTSSISPSFYGRPGKPPPPPRSQSLDSALGGGVERPVRPPPPSKDFRPSDLAPSPSTSPTNTVNSHSVYVNIGEVRSSIIPAKPQRTGSLREKDSTEPLYQSSALQITENLYESLAPECDSSRERTSLPYYGSETESDIYCPYTFNNSQKGGEELRACKARSVVHKNMEDNYGAVVVANHEALTQLLEQMSQRPVVPPALRPLKSQSLQWMDFTLDGVGGSADERVGGRVFLPAHWGAHPVSLCVTAGQSRLPPCFAPITQFFDLVASQFVHQDKSELVQVSVAVLVRQEFFSLHSVSSALATGVDAVRESALLAIQVVNSLKTLQVQGRKESSLSHFVLTKEDKQSSPRVCLMPDDVDKGQGADSESMSLCQCALKVVDLLTLPEPLSAILRSVLSDERATSLTQAKAALELWLWGPTHVPVSQDTQGSLQRWLDLERATVLHSLVVRRPLALGPSDHCHLSFLVKTNSKVMADALTLLAPAANTAS